MFKLAPMENRPILFLIHVLSFVILLSGFNSSSLKKKGFFCTFCVCLDRKGKSPYDKVESESETTLNKNILSLALVGPPLPPPWSFLCSCWMPLVGTALTTACSGEGTGCYWKSLLLLMRQSAYNSDPLVNPSCH